MTEPELTPDQRLDVLESDLKQNADTVQDMADDWAERAVKAANMYSDFMWLRYDSATVSAPTEEIADYKADTDGSPSQEPSR